MKQKLISLAVGAAVLAPAVSMADVKVYGRVDVSLTMNSTDDSSGATTVDNWSLDSNSSRLGFKGSNELDNGWTAFYKAEFGTQVDTGDGPFSKRNIYGGLKGGFGEVMFGQFDTPLKKAQGKIGLFGDHKGELGKAAISGRTRLKNAIQYTSPKIADAIKLKLAFAPGEECSFNPDFVDSVTTPDEEPCPDENTGLADATSMSATYKSGPLYASLALDTGINKNGVDDRTLLALGYKMDSIRLGFIFETAESDPAGTDSTGMAVTAGMKAGSNLFKFQYQTREVETTTTADTTVLALGVDHKLAKKTMAYAEFTSKEVDGGDESTYLAFGLQHKF